jgi:hypothetical protein
MGLAVDSGFSKILFPLAENAGIVAMASTWTAMTKRSITNMGVREIFAIR